MDGDVEQVERLFCAAAPGAPADLRSAVLADVRRELRASAWDRMLARSAAAIVVVGVGLNAALGLRGDARMAPGGQATAIVDARQDALVQTAAAIAEATDAAMGRSVARQLAALSGRTLTDDQAAAIDAALRNRRG